MKKQTIQLDNDNTYLVKETAEQRKERIRIGGMYTRVAKPRKGKGSYNRQAYKQGK